MYKYADWNWEESCKSEKEVLMTLAQLRKERKDADEKGMDDAQSDQMRDCWCTLKDIYHVRSMMMDAKTKGHIMHHSTPMAQA